MMIEEDEYDESSDEEDRDFAPLLSDASEKHNILGTKRASFEILPALRTTHEDAYSATKIRCITTVASLVVFLLAGGSLIRLGFSRAPTGTSNVPSEVMMTTIPLETCEQRFNMTYDALLDQVETHQSFCTPELPNCCKSPFVPKLLHLDGNYQERWDSAFQQNKASANDATENPYDVVFFGDSITEHWNGRDLGAPNGNLKGAHEVFNEYFSKDNGGKIAGLALGIGGDRVSSSSQGHEYSLGALNI
jgi:hypothetical protein